MSYSVKLNKDGVAEHVKPSEDEETEIIGVPGFQRRIPRTLNKTGAIRLANMIARYWRERGATTLQCRVQRDHSIQEIELWTVRSNLIGGLPPKAV